MFSNNRYLSQYILPLSAEIKLFTIYFQQVEYSRRIPMRIHSFGVRITCRYCPSHNRPRVAPPQARFFRNDAVIVVFTVSFLTARAIAGAAPGHSERRTTCSRLWGQRSQSKSFGTWFPLASKTRAPFFWPAAVRAVPASC